MANYPHMLAIFDEDTARAPTGLELLYKEHRKQQFFDEQAAQEMQRRCCATLERSYSGYKVGSRRKVELGDGNGFSYEVGTYCHYCSRNGVHALFAGEVAEWPGIDAIASAHDAFVRGDPDPEPNTQNDATWLLDFYDTFKEFTALDVTSAALRSLDKVRGQFAFVIFDPLLRRVWAARDRDATQPLYWGVTDDGRFLFGSDVVDLVDCNPSATPFPAGTMYASEANMRAMSPGERGWVIAGEPWPGKLLSFVRHTNNTPGWRDVKLIPRVNSAGMLCGAVYRVASEQNVAGVPPSVNLAST